MGIRNFNDKTSSLLYFGKGFSFNNRSLTRTVCPSLKDFHTYIESVSFFVLDIIPLFRKSWVTYTTPMMNQVLYTLHKYSLYHLYFSAEITTCAEACRKSKRLGSQSTCVLRRATAMTRALNCCIATQKISNSSGQATCLLHIARTALISSLLTSSNLDRL